jgi:hypothetical protein
MPPKEVKKGNFKEILIKVLIDYRVSAQCVARSSFTLLGKFSLLGNFYLVRSL